MASSDRKKSIEERTGYSMPWRLWGVELEGHSFDVVVYARRVETEYVIEL